MSEQRRIPLSVTVEDYLHIVRALEETARSRRDHNDPDEAARLRAIRYHLGEQAQRATYPHAPDTRRWYR